MDEEEEKKKIEADALVPRTLGFEHRFTLSYSGDRERRGSWTV